MGYGDPLVTTDGPSYGQPIVRNVGSSGGSSFENPFPDPVTFSAVADFLQDIEMRDNKTLWLDTLKAFGFRYSDAEILILGGDLAAQDELIITANKTGGIYYPRLTFQADGDAELIAKTGRSLTLISNGGNRIAIAAALTTHEGPTSFVDNVGFYAASPAAQGAHLSGGGITAAAIYAQLELMGIFAAA